MIRILIFIILILAGVLISCIFGIVHDQLTYLISPDFYTKIRFPQYNIDSNAAQWGVTVVAIYSSWKIGFIFSIIITAMGAIHNHTKKFIKHTLQAYLVVVTTTTIFGILGYILELSKKDLDNVNFIRVQSIHNFTYIGGIIGMFLGLCWHFYRHKKNRVHSENLL